MSSSTSAKRFYDKYGIRFQDNKEFKEFIDKLSGEVARRLNDARSRGKQITLKLMTRHPDAPLEAAKVTRFSLLSHVP